MSAACRAMWVAAGATVQVAVKAALLLATLATPTAHAGRACEDKPLDVHAVTQGMALADRTAAALDRSGAQVLLLARAGQDLSAYGLRWSHLGFVYREVYRDASRERPVWRVLHKLNHCGTAQADLYRQGLGEFFMDRPYRFEAAYVALAPTLQAQLLPLLKDNARAAVLHAKRYNMVAYPWSTAYQQSNQWAIETLAMAATAEPTGASGSPANGTVFTRASAQQWLQRQGYQPTTLHLGPLTRLGARVTAANVAFDDHPSAQRFAGRINTVTADSVFDWLTLRELATPVGTVR